MWVGGGGRENTFAIIYVVAGVQQCTHIQVHKIFVVSGGIGEYNGSYHNIVLLYTLYSKWQSVSKLHVDTVEYICYIPVNSVCTVYIYVLYVRTYIHARRKKLLTCKM